MIAALAYALRRTSARVVLAFALGGLVLVVYRALRVDVVAGCSAAPLAAGTQQSLCTRDLPMSTSWDLAVGAGAVVAALVVAAVLWRGRDVPA